jgi:hypothetical protein
MKKKDIINAHKECRCGKYKGNIEFLAVHYNYTILSCDKCHGMIGALDRRINGENYAKKQYAEAALEDMR